MENIAKNNCSKTSVFLLNSANQLGRKDQFDIILANINRNVLSQAIPFLSKLLKEDGYLLISGFYIEDNEDLIKQSEKNNLKFIRSTNKDGWSSLLLQHNK